MIILPESLVDISCCIFISMLRYGLICASWIRQDSKISFPSSKSSSAAGNSVIGNSRVGFKMVSMPRGEYLKHFARDEGGVYIGTELQREWTCEELEERYGKYQVQVVKKKRLTTKIMDKLMFGF